MLVSVRAAIKAAIKPKHESRGDQFESASSDELQHVDTLGPEGQAYADPWRRCCTYEESTP